MPGLSENIPFVGRKYELGVVRECLEEMLQGYAQIIWIAGEAGIGKSRLVEQVSSQAAKRDVLCAFGHCFQRRTAAPYEPFLAPLSKCLASLSEHDDAATRQVADLLSSLTADYSPSVGVAALEMSQIRLFTAVRDVVTRACIQQPLLLVFEDLHDADPPTLDLLDYLAERWPEFGRGLLVCTYRPEETAPGHPLYAIMTRLQGRSHTHRLELGGLLAAEVADLVELVAGPATRVHAPTILERTDGNPFFVSELAHYLITAAPDAPIALVPLPSKLLNWILLRIGRLSAACRHLLAHAAICGDEFAYWPLPAFSQIPPGQALDALEEALAAEVIRQLPDQAEESRYRFRHALFREALYFGMSAPRRQEGHLRLARLLRERAAGLSVDTVQHYLLAGKLASASERLDALLAGIGHAQSAMAFVEVEKLAVEALSLADDDRLRSELWAALGLARRCHSDWQGAVQALHNARDAVPAADHRARAAIDAELAVIFAWWGRYQQASQAIDQGLKGFEPVDKSTDRIRLTATAALVTAVGGQRSVSQRLLDQLSALTGDSLDRAHLAWCALAREVYAVCFWDRAAVACSEEGIAAADQGGDWWTVCLSRFLALPVFMPAARLLQARRLAEELAILAQRQGDQTWRAWANHVLAYLALLQGRPSEANALVYEAIQHSRQAGATTLTAYFSVTCAETAGLLGDHAAARAFLEEGDAAYRAGALSSAPALAYDPRAWLALWLAREGQRTEAIRLANEIPYVLTPGRKPTLARVFNTLTLVEALGVAVESVLLPQLYGLALEAVRDREVLLNIPVRLVAGQLGVGAAGLGRWSEAEEHFHTAVSQAQSLHAPFALGEARYWHGRCLLRRNEPGDETRAREMLQQAADLFAELGVTHYAQSALDRLSHGGQLAAPASRSAGQRQPTICYEPDSGRLFVDGREIEQPLSPQERSLLEYLWLHTGKLCTNMALREHLWGGVADETDLPALVMRLRRKVEPEPSQPIFIVNVPRAGYRLDHAVCPE